MLFYCKILQLLKHSVGDNLPQPRIPVTQAVEHGANNGKIPRECIDIDNSIIIYSLDTMYSKSLMKKTSKCINVKLFLMKTHISDRVQLQENTGSMPMHS